MEAHTKGEQGRAESGRIDSSKSRQLHFVILLLVAESQRVVQSSASVNATHTGTTQLLLIPSLIIKLARMAAFTVEDAETQPVQRRHVLVDVETYITL